jgi:hypothetical protein
MDNYRGITITTSLYKIFRPTMDQPPLKYGDAQIRQSEEFKYLGLWLYHRDWFAMAGQSMAEAAEKST